MYLPVSKELLLLTYLYLPLLVLRCTYFSTGLKRQLSKVNDDNFADDQNDNDSEDNMVTKPAQ